MSHIPRLRLKATRPRYGHLKKVVVNNADQTSLMDSALRESEAFYRQMVYIGTLLTRHGVPVVFDATANRRRYREHARQQISNFMEVYVECPMDICMVRDPKGIYRKAREGAADTVPGLQSAYEPPDHPDLIVDGSREMPETAAQRVLTKLAEKGYLHENLVA